MKRVFITLLGFLVMALFLAPLSAQEVLWQRNKSRDFPNSVPFGWGKFHSSGQLEELRCYESGQQFLLSTINMRTGEITWTLSSGFYCIGFSVIMDVDNDGIDEFEVITQLTQTSDYMLTVYKLSSGGLAEEPVQPSPTTPQPSLNVSPSPIKPNLNSTRIQYTLPRQDQISINIYDASGRLIRAMVSGQQPAGGHQVQWNGQDQNGQSVGAGAYYVELRCRGQGPLTRKQVVVE